MKGKHKLTEFHYRAGAFLEAHGAPPGSIYDTNPSAYMTDALWDANVDAFAAAVRLMHPSMMAMPHWVVECHFDGFHSKVLTPYGQKVLRQRNIRVVQSYSHTSHLNQSFDDAPGKSSKGSQKFW